jgi:acetylornithine deacetylase/succinyl-diaminopimelate desuccinylase-like protein
MPFMRSDRLPLLLLSLLTLASCATGVGPATPAPSVETIANVERIVASAAVRAAFDWIDANREPILGEWRALTEIEAPSGKELERAAEVERLLRAIPSLEVARDEVGNVIAVRKGAGGGPAVAVDAHLDTVFHEIAEVTTRVENGRVHGAGIGDNTRNIESVLAMLRALDAAGIRTKGDVIATFTVEEETSFKGINHLLATRGAEFDHFIALDGGFGSFTYGGTGTYWIRYHFVGPGGHTRSRTPPFSASLPLARTIDRIYRLEIPAEPPTWINVGMLGGSDVINEKAEDAWFSLDLRSIDQKVLDRLDDAARAIASEEAARAGMRVREEVVDKWPAAQIPGHRGSALVLTSEAVLHAMGFDDPSITATASNHSSAALRSGISAISTGTAPCGDAHIATEWCDIEGFYRGTKTLIAMTLAMTGIAGE